LGREPTVPSSINYIRREGRVGKGTVGYYEVPPLEIIYEEKGGKGKESVGYYEVPPL
jgi:hypothetical protein